MYSRESPLRSAMAAIVTSSVGLYDAHDQQARYGGGDVCDGAGQRLAEAVGLAIERPVLSAVAHPEQSVVAAGLIQRIELLVVQNIDAAEEQREAVDGGACHWLVCCPASLLSVCDGLANVLVWVSVSAGHQSSNLLEVVNSDRMNGTPSRVSGQAKTRVTEGRSAGKPTGLGDVMREAAQLGSPPPHSVPSHHRHTVPPRHATRDAAQLLLLLATLELPQGDGSLGAPRCADLVIRPNSPRRCEVRAAARGVAYGSCRQHFCPYRE